MGKVTITLKGNNSKKVFLDKISQDSGIHFKNVPKATIILETNDCIATSFFGDFSKLNLLNEVEFKGLDVTTEVKSQEKNFKSLGIKQKEVLQFLKSRPMQSFSTREILQNVWVSETNLKRILVSLIERNLIKKTTNIGMVKYYYPSNDVEFEKTQKIPDSVTEYFG